MSQFSTHEAVSLEKRVEINENISKTDPENIDTEYEIEKCVKWVIENNYEKVCLQFPDYLINDSVEVINRLEKNLQKKVYILGDTAYESCCIDFTSAQHISGDAIVHYGKTCFSKPEKIIPFLKIYSKINLNVDEFCNSVENSFKEVNNLTILVDTPFIHKIDDIKDRLKNENICLVSIEEGLQNLENNTIIYIGENDKKIMNIQLILNSQTLFICNPKESYSIKNYEIDSKILKRRYFLMEKIKDSKTIGIVIGTLAVKNYLKILERVKSLIKLHSKKYYIISVGKPTVAKLANFPEVDVFVVISCALNEIYENRDFYKPIVTPFDIEASLNPRHDTNINFTYDFNNYLSLNNEILPEFKNDIVETDVSLVSGKIRFKETDISNLENETVNSELTEKQLVVRDQGKVALNSNFGAGFLSNRTWQGLEQNLGSDEPQLALKGRKGLAFGYENEKENK